VKIRFLRISHPFLIFFSHSRRIFAEAASGIAGFGGTRTLNAKGTPVRRVSRRDKPRGIFFCASFPKRGGVAVALTARIAAARVMDAVHVLAARRENNETEDARA
jgi:hypothetical protein